jgi:TRAP-type C4-dicarboxylate transport system permease small subunit
MIERALDGLTRAIRTALGVAFIFAVVLNFANVVGRYAFGKALFGADEVQTMILVWMAFLGAVVVTWRREHLRMDVLLGYLPRAARSFLVLCELVLLAVIAGFVAMQSWHYVALMFSLGRRSDAAGILIGIPHSAVTVGFVLIALIALWRLVAFVAGRGAADRSGV